jgi:hypothetical protein
MRGNRHQQFISTFMHPRSVIPGELLAILAPAAGIRLRGNQELEGIQIDLPFVTLGLP